MKEGKKTFSKFSLIVGLLYVFYMIWPSLNPWNDGMFSFHDPTQVGRVTSFVNNLKAGEIPPRIAPEYSFRLSFPVFSYYAPTSYWITASFALLGFSSTDSVKLSFLFAVSVSFIGMYYLLKKLFSSKELPAVIGASVYVSSTYFATEIMIRGNLAETWFLALFPLALGLVVENSFRDHKGLHIFSILVFALLFTSHNMMMLFVVPIVFVFLLFFPNRKKNCLFIFLALSIDSYFFIPAFIESSFVQAGVIAKEYAYTDHFLCPWQLWRANGWQFGGSLPGCDADTMSFKIGKVQLILGILGVVIFYFKIFKKSLTQMKSSLLRKKKLNRITINSHTVALLFISVMSLGALFLTLTFSQLIWSSFSSIMSLFQFPWRFIVFGLFGVAVFAGYLFNLVKLPFEKLWILLILSILFIPARKYFIKPLIPLDEYAQQFDSDEYLTEHLAFKMPEYIARNVDISYWRSLEPSENHSVNLGFDMNLPVQFLGESELLENKPFIKRVLFKQQGEAYLNIHYFPFWKIILNGSEILPETFDQLARPILKVEKSDVVEIRYAQTSIEMFANSLSIIGILVTSLTFWWLQQRKLKLKL